MRLRLAEPRGNFGRKKVCVDLLTSRLNETTDGVVATERAVECVWQELMVVGVFRGEVCLADEMGVSSIGRAGSLLSPAHFSPAAVPSSPWRVAWAGVCG